MNFTRAICTRQLSGAISSGMKRPGAISYNIVRMSHQGLPDGRPEWNGDITKPLHMDDFPIPQGCWHAQHATDQSKYNRHFIVGVGIFLTTLWVYGQSGIIFFNAYPPPLPELGECEWEECEGPEILDKKW